PQQQGLGTEGLVELEFVALLSSIDLERPTCMLVALTSARGLHDAVERDELTDHDPSHVSNLLVRSLPRAPPDLGRRRKSSVSGEGRESRERGLRGDP